MYPTPLEPERSGPSVVATMIPVALLAGLMWVQEIIDSLPGTNLDQFGIRPRDLDGLAGIPAAPFLHVDFAHLIANTGAFLILGGLIAFTARRFWAATIGIAVLGGLGTWLIAAPYTVHIGASGLVYGYAAFLVAWGVLVRRPLALAVAVVVVLMYGGIVSGLLPGTSGVSWEGHLCGALAGIVVAWWAAQRRERSPASYS